MFKRFVIVFSLVAAGASLGGCTKCGWIWDDWQKAPQSCRSDAPR
jgi:hypothetical protein